MRSKEREGEKKVCVRERERERESEKLPHHIPVQELLRLCTKYVVVVVVDVVVDVGGVVVKTSRSQELFYVKFFRKKNKLFHVFLITFKSKTIFPHRNLEKASGVNYKL